MAGGLNVTPVISRFSAGLGVDSDDRYGYGAGSRMNMSSSTVAGSSNQSDGEAYAYDADGNRTSLSATVNGTADLKDTFTFNNLDELTGETQQGQSGGNAVTPEGVTFGYDAVGNVTTMGHFSDTSMSTSVYTTTNTYDHDERLSGVTNNSSSVSLTQSYGYNADSWLTSESNGTDGSRTYYYDNDGNETAVNKGSGSSFVNEVYMYDVAGNRLSRRASRGPILDIDRPRGGRLHAVAPAGDSQTLRGEPRGTLTVHPATRIFHGDLAR